MRREERNRRLDQFERRCREAGLPVTVQRRAVLEDLLQRDDHPTADQVFDSVRRRIPQISRTTVYRVLQTLVGLGVIRRVHHPKAAARFDGRTSRHHHLVCTRCDRMMDFEGSALDELPLPEARPRGFEIEEYTVQLLGRCADCRRKGE